MSRSEMRVRVHSGDRDLVSTLKDIDESSYFNLCDIRDEYLSHLLITADPCIDHGVSSDVGCYRLLRIE